MVAIMTLHLGWLVGIAAVAFALFALVTVLSAMNVLKMSDASFRLHPLGDEELPTGLACFEETSLWADANRFRFVGNYYTPAVLATRLLMSVWQHEDEPTFLCLYCPCTEDGKVNERAINVEFATQFSNEVDLDTCWSRDGHAFPRRVGSYAQSVATTDLDELWRSHQEGMHFVLRWAGVELRPLEKDLLTEIAESVQDQMAHIRSLPLWYLRGGWWYFVRRRRLHNVPIEDQHRRGWIKMPGEG